MSRQVLILFLAIAGIQRGNAQNTAIREGNKLYKEGRYDDALTAYDKAVKKNPGDATAMYNRSNTLAKKGDKAAAMEAYDKIISNTADAGIKERSYYDKGVLHQQQQQLDESIEAWKAALKLDPEDKSARENLEKALREKKKQEQKKDEKKKDEQKKDKPDKKEQDKPKPEPQQSKLNQKQVEQLLKALEQKEKEVQKKLQQRTASPNHPEKDW